VSLDVFFGVFAPLAGRVDASLLFALANLAL
jgi:hypothetical protein